jgi:hypothetical protein
MNRKRPLEVEPVDPSKKRPKIEFSSSSSPFSTSAANNDNTIDSNHRNPSQIPEKQNIVTTSVQSEELTPEQLEMVRKEYKMASQMKFITCLFFQLIFFSLFFVD